MEAIIKKKMSPNLVDRVDFNTEVEVFVDLVAHTLKARAVQCSAVQYSVV